MKLLSYAIALIAVVGILSTGCAKKAVKSEALGEGFKAQVKEEKAVQIPEQMQQAKPVEEKTVQPEEMAPKAEAQKQAAPVKQEEAVQIPEQMQQAKPVEEKTVQPEEMAPKAEPQKEAAPVIAAKGIGDIFFDFDRFSIKDDAKPILEANAEYLKNNKNLKVVIGGHCDERGTSEYNIALGERRAKAAQQYLIDLGIEPSRISIISYGEEKPFCAEHNEQCWQQNRRAHFVEK